MVSLLIQTLNNNLHIRIRHKQNLNIKLVQPDNNITPNSRPEMHLRFQIKLDTHHQLNFPSTSILPLSSCPEHQIISINHQPNSKGELLGRRRTLPAGALSPSLVGNFGSEETKFVAIAFPLVSSLGK
jgi:hypothetical protein